MKRWLMIAIAVAACDSEGGDAKPSTGSGSGSAKPGSAGGFSASMSADLAKLGSGSDAKGSDTGSDAKAGSGSDAKAGSGSAVAMAGSDAKAGSASDAKAGSASDPKAGSASDPKAGSAAKPIDAKAGSAAVAVVDPKPGSAAKPADAKAGSAAVDPKAGSAAKPIDAKAGSAAVAVVDPKAGSAAKPTDVKAGSAAVDPKAGSGSAAKPVPLPPVKASGDLAAIKLNMEPNWDRDLVEPGTISLVEKRSGKTFTFRYGYDDPRAPVDRDQYKKWLSDQKLLSVTLDRQRGAAWYLEGSDANGAPAFRYLVNYGGKKLICGGSLYKDAESGKLGDIRDRLVIQAKQICESLSL